MMDDILCMKDEECLLFYAKSHHLMENYVGWKFNIKYNLRKERYYHRHFE